MIRTAFSFLIVLLTLSQLCMAQDKIYLKDKTMISAKVINVGTSTVVYKRFDNQSGPDYTVDKADVDRIVYENGTTDRFSQESYNDPRQMIMEHLRQRREHRHNHDKAPKYGDNIISIMPGMYTVAMLDGSVNDPGIGFCYERALDAKGHVAFVLPVNINFSQEKDFTSDFYGYNPSTSFSGSYHSWLMAPGIKVYPLDNTWMARYAFGGSLFAMFGSEPAGVYDFSNSGATGNWNYTLFGLYLSNSLNVSVTRHFFMAFDISFLIPFSDNRRKDSYAFENLAAPMIQFSLRTGYRF